MSAQNSEDGGGDGRRRRDARGAVIPISERTLSPEHLSQLRASGLSDETIAAAGLYSLGDSAQISRLLSRPRWTQGEVLVFPYLLPGRDEPVFCRVRPSRPRIEVRKNGRERTIKYEQPRHTSIVPYFPPRLRARALGDETHLPLAFTEGEKKALLLDQLGIPCIGAPGVTTFHDVPKHQAGQGYYLHPLVIEHVPIKGRLCYIVFDSDAADKPEIMRAAMVLGTMLRAAGAEDARMVEVPPGDGRKKRGIDDYFVDARSDAGAVRALFDAAPPLRTLPSARGAVPVRMCPTLERAPVDEGVMMPHSYGTDRSGQLWRADDEEHFSALVERSPILLSRRLIDVHTGAHRVEVCWPTEHGYQKSVVARDAICDSRTAVREMSPIGAPIDSTTASRVVEYLRSFEHENDALLVPVYAVGRAGWQTVRGHRVFALGEVIPPRSADLPDIAVDGSLLGMSSVLSALHGQGELSRHIALLSRVWETDPIGATLVCASFAAPLLRLVRAKNFIIHVPGDSSRGKTSMLRFAASVYGDPESDQWVASWNSTAVGIESRAAGLCDLPLLLDESSATDPQALERAVYMIANGIGRQRGAKQGGVRETLAWHTIALSTGESSLAGITARSGAQARVLELRLAGERAESRLDAKVIGEIRAGLSEHYGIAGRVWLDWLVNAPPDKLEELCGAYAECVAAYNALRLEGVETRQASYVALLVVTETYLHDLFGLGSPTGETMDRWIETAAVRARVLPAADRALLLLGDWIQSDPNAFVDITIDAAGAYDTKLAGVRQLAGYRAGREMLLVPTALRTFLGEHGIDAENVLPDWRAKGYLGTTEDGRTTRKQMIRGVRHRVIPLRVSALEDPGTVVAADLDPTEDPEPGYLG